MEATRMVRRRRPGVAVLLALGVIGLALAIVAGRPGPGPVLTTIAVGSFSGGASLSVDEEAGRAYVVAYSGGGSAGRAVVRVLDTTRATVVRTTALPGQPFGLTTVLVDARRGRAYAASTGSTSCGSSGGGPQTCTTTGAAVVVLDARTGQPLRTLAVDAGRGLALDGRTGLLYALPSAGGTPSGGPPTSGGGTTRVTVIDPRTGRVVRTIVLPGGGQGFGFGTLAIDARGGRLVVVRTVPSGFGRFGAPPSAVDVVALADGRLLRHASLPGARVGPVPSLLIDEPRERAFVIAGAGVSTLDPRRGTLVRVTPTGGARGRWSRTRGRAMSSPRPWVPCAWSPRGRGTARRARRSPRASGACACSTRAAEPSCAACPSARRRPVSRSTSGAGACTCSASGSPMRTTGSRAPAR